MLIDANIFLEFFLQQKRADDSLAILEKLGKGEMKAYVSHFTIDSVLLIMHQNRCSHKELNTFLQNIINSKGISLYHANLNDRFLAITLMEKYNLDYEDALTLRCALSVGSKEILSFDKDFDTINEIKRIEP
jgi:predicted nucleic acid-binding protein